MKRQKKLIFKGYKQEKNETDKTKYFWDFLFNKVLKLRANKKSARKSQTPQL